MSTDEASQTKADSAEEAIVVDSLLSPSMLPSDATPANQGVNALGDGASLPSDSATSHSSVPPASLARSDHFLRRFRNAAGVGRSTSTADLIIVFLCFVFVHWLYLGDLNINSNRVVILLAALALNAATLQLGAMYNPRIPRPMHRELGRLTACWIWSLAALGLIAYLTKTAEDVSRVWVSGSMALALISLATIRIVRALVKTSNTAVTRDNVAVIGLQRLVLKTMKQVELHSWSNKTVVGQFFLDDLESLSKPGSLPEEGYHLRVASALHDFVESRRRSGDPVDEVWIALPLSASATAAELTERLRDSSVDVCIVPDSYGEALLSGTSTRLGGMSVVNISDVALPAGADQYKRAFDVCLASLALVLLAVPMLCIALAVKLSSPGPVLFRQHRYGVDGQEIEILKFRSMRVHKDAQVRQATRGDDRVTRTGRFLRRSSLDELPQLINVLRGEMSIVGPRPHAVTHNETWRGQINGYMLRHKVRPGITGWAQVNGWRGETDTAEKMKRRVDCDLEYIRTWSPWLDIKIIILTAVQMVTGEDVY